MQAQILESVYLVVNLHITHVVERVGSVVLLIKTGYGVIGSIGVLQSRIVRIVERLTLVSPCEIAMEVFECGVIREDRLRGIHSHSVADGVGIGIACVRVHELTIDVEFQMVFEERRIQRHAGSCTLVVGCLQNTILVGIAGTETVRHVLQTTLNSDVVVAADS